MARYGTHPRLGSTAMLLHLGPTTRHKWSKTTTMMTMATMTMTMTITRTTSKSLINQWLNDQSSNYRTLILIMRKIRRGGLGHDNLISMQVECGRSTRWLEPPCSMGLQMVVRMLHTISVPWLWRLQYIASKWDPLKHLNCSTFTSELETVPGARYTMLHSFWGRHR